MTAVYEAIDQVGPTVMAKYYFEAPNALHEALTALNLDALNKKTILDESGGLPEGWDAALCAVAAGGAADHDVASMDTFNAWLDSEKERRGWASMPMLRLWT